MTDPRDPQAQPPFVWRPGEHACVVGDTGTGKSYLQSTALLRYREYVVVFKTKPDPDDDEKYRGFYRARTHRALSDTRRSRILLEPRYREQAREGYDMLQAVYRMGGWTVCIDELWYAEKIGLAPTIEMLLTQGRSKGITVVIGQQRPVTTTRFAISQTTHFFSFRVEGRDSKTIAEATTPRILPVLDSLTGFNFAYYNRRARYVGVGNAKRLGALLIPIPRKSASETLDNGTDRSDARSDSGRTGVLASVRRR